MVVETERGSALDAKRCKRCFAEKSLHDFYANKQRADGLRAECKDCVKELSRAAYLANKSRRAETVRAWRAANPEKIKEYVRNRNRPAQVRAVRRWQVKNAERRRAYRREYRHINPASVVASELRRKRALEQAFVSWTNRTLISDIYREARRRSKETGVRWEVDHIVPLRHPLVCGLHVHTNLQIITQHENRTKSNVVWPEMPASALN